MTNLISTVVVFIHNGTEMGECSLCGEVQAIAHMDNNHCDNTVACHERMSFVEIEIATRETIEGDMAMIQAEGNDCVEERRCDGCDEITKVNKLSVENNWCSLCEDKAYDRWYDKNEEKYITAMTAIDKQDYPF